MNILTVINPENVEERDVDDWRTRQAARAVVFKGAPQFTDEESMDGFEIVWVEPDQARRLLNLGQTSDYEGIFIEKRDLRFLEEALKHF